MSTARIIALIPARAGSKGVPNKNVRVLGGHPLLGWSIAACRKTATIDRVIVSTNSSDYAFLAQKLGAEAPFLRPEELSGDYSPDHDFIVHALDWLAAHGEEPDYIVHIRPTTPIRDPRVIDEAVNTFMGAPHATALRSVHEIAESAYKMFELSPGGWLKRIGSDSTAMDTANNPRQQYPSTYHANGYVDVLSTSFIRKKGLIHGDYVIPFMTPSVIEIDTEDDLAHLEYQLIRSPGVIHKLFD